MNDKKAEEEIPMSLHVVDFSSISFQGGPRGGRGEGTIGLKLPDRGYSPQPERGHGWTRGVVKRSDWKAGPCSGLVEGNVVGRMHQ